MPIHHAIWRFGETPTLLNTTRLNNEQQLEAMIVRNPRILSSEWMLIGSNYPGILALRSSSRSWFLEAC